MYLVIVFASLTFQTQTLQTFLTQPTLGNGPVECLQPHATVLVDYSFFFFLTVITPEKGMLLVLLDGQTHNRHTGRERADNMHLQDQETVTDCDMVHF